MSNEKELNLKLETANKRIAELEGLLANADTAAGEAAAKIAQLGADLETANAEVLSLTKQVADLNQIIASAGATTPKKQDDTAAAVVAITEVEKDGKTWVCNKQVFRLAGYPAEYTAAQAVADDNLWKRLMAIKGQKVFAEKA